MSVLDAATEIVSVDFEFSALPGHRPKVWCLAAREHRSGRRYLIDRDELLRMTSPPFDIGPRTIIVGYFLSAEMDCFLELGWPCPENLLDLFVEFRNQLNGHTLPLGFSIQSCLQYFGERMIEDKDYWRQVAIDGPKTEEEWRGLMAYCMEDVDACDALLPKVCGYLKTHDDLRRALLRGRYAWAVSNMQRRGVPIDMPLYSWVTSRLDSIGGEVRESLNPKYGVFRADGSFDHARFRKYLIRENIAFPLDDAGRPLMDEDTWSDVVKYAPQLLELHQYRQTFESTKNVGLLTIGPDGRNRALLSQFRARTGRNQPSTTKFAFGPSKWTRSFIRPAPGMQLDYLDWRAQETAIAAALSGDEAMMEDYQRSDFYLAFAIRAGLAPPDATKKSHANIRKVTKTVCLGVMFGQTAYGMAAKLGISCPQAAKILRAHKRLYHRFWAWSNAAVDMVSVRGVVRTCFDWRLHRVYCEDRVAMNKQWRSVQNFPTQAHGAEMLRLACIYAADEGLPIIAPVHDAIMIEAPTSEMPEVSARMEFLMRKASRDVLRDFEVDVEHSLTGDGERYEDEDGQAFFERIMKEVGEPPASPGAVATPCYLSPTSSPECNMQ
jgi:DNA polymerase I